MDNESQRNDSFTEEWANLWGLDQLSFENELLLPSGTQTHSNNGQDGTSTTTEVAGTLAANDAVASDVRR